MIELGALTRPPARFTGSAAGRPGRRATRSARRNLTRAPSSAVARICQKADHVQNDRSAHLREPRDPCRRLARARDYWLHLSHHHGDDRLSEPGRFASVRWPDRANPQSCNRGSESDPFGTTRCGGLSPGDYSSPTPIRQTIRSRLTLTARCQTLFLTQGARNGIFSPNSGRWRTSSRQHPRSETRVERPGPGFRVGNQ